MPDMPLSPDPTDDVERDSAGRNALVCEPLELPCGVELPNRLAKGAMSEHLAYADHRPNELHHRLYARWAATGCGTLITGNLMVDGQHLEGAGNVIAEDESIVPSLAELAGAVGDTSLLWAQLSHPGRQSASHVNPQPISASAIAPTNGEFFNPPRAMSEDEVLNVIERFATSARLCVEAGLGGVQLHAAYGYLLSSFGSPRSNKRTDRWGGSAENRRRLLLETIRAVREEIGPDRALSVKVNCSDFLRGGLTEQEALDTVVALDAAGVDVIDISAGSYDKSISFIARYQGDDAEALFIPFSRACKELVRRARIMVTGNLRSAEYVERILAADWVDVIGIARPMISDLEYCAELLDGGEGSPWEPALEYGTATDAEKATLEICWYYEQLRNLAEGREIDRELTASVAQERLFARDREQARDAPANRRLAS